MAKNIVGYIANLGKSVSYSAVDKVKSMTPSSAEFVESNSELFKSVYNSVRDYKITYKRGMDIFSKSKIYEAGDVLKTSLIEDIKTGKLYNKEREDAIAMKSMGLSDQDMNLDFDFDGFDDNFDFSADDVTTGDKIVSNSIDSSSRKSAEMISTVTARTGEYIVENQKMTTNLLYTQHMQTHSMLHGSLSSINDNIGSMINFSNDVIKTHVDNSATYYKKSTELLQDQTALLREIVDILKPKEDKKEEKQKDRLTYDDIVGANGMPDLKLYLSNIKKNSENMSGMLSSMNNMFGEDTNMLATLVSSPLKFIPNAIVNTIVPKAIEESMGNLDKSLGSIFGSMVTKFNTMAKSDNMIESTIGSLLGVRSAAKDDIDTSKYNKGKVDWDGKSKKALEEVIPSQLAKIISLLSGQGEKIYDYEKGKFISGKDIKDNYENMKKSYRKSSTSDMEDYMKDYAKLMTFNSLKEKKSFEEDLEKFFSKLYDENKLFDVNSATLDQDHLEYGIDSKNFRTIRTLYKKAPKYMQHQINADILEGRNKQSRDFKDIEDSGNSILHYLFNGSNIDEFIKENKLEKKTSSVLTNNLNSTVDKFGRNIFYYLQNIYKELSFMRQYGSPTGTGPNKIQDPMKIVSSNGTEYSPAEKTIKDIAIPRNPRKPRAEEQEEIDRREEERFRRSELKRRENSDLINYSDEENERLLGSKLSLKIDEERFNRRRELEESREPSIIDRLLAAQNLSEKTRVMIDKITELSRKPTEFVTATIDKVDQRMYEFVYGREDSHGSNDIKGFLDLTLYELRNTFSKFNNFMDEKILNPLKDKLGLGKEKFKGFLSSIGLDPAEIRKNIKTFFFGDKDTGKEGLLTSTVQAVKDNAKSLFGTVKDSVSSTTAPLRDKLKSKFRSRRQDLLNDMDDLDEQGDDYVDSEEQNPYDLQNRINRLTGVSRATSDRTQQYYDQIDWDSDENQEYLDKNTYASGIRTVDDETAELYYLHERIRELTNEANSANNVTRRIAILNELTPLKQRYDELKTSVQGFHQSKKRYKNRLANKKFDNINKYYTDSISRSLDMDNDENFKQVMNHMFESRRDSKNTDFTVEDLMRSARKLSLDNQDGEKYESIIDKITDYTDKYYGSDIDKKLSTLAEEGYYQKLYDPESYRSEGLPRTAEEYYEMSSDFNDGKNIISEIEEGNESLNNHTSLLREISDNIKSLKDLFTSLSRGGGRNPGPGPRLDLNPDLITTPEGRATHTFAQELVTMISNWMYGRTPHFDKGGYIDQPTVATVGKGEIVLSAENVDKMTSVFNDVISGIKNKERTKKVATGTLDKLAQESGLDMDNIKSIEEFVRNNPKVKANYDSMTKTEKKKYAKVINFLDYQRVEKDEKQEADNETLVNQIKDELLSGTRAVSRSLFGEPKEDRKKFGEVVNDVTGNISKYAPDMIGKGVIGAGISLVTGAIGGPLLGAAVGAGISLTKNSSKVQDFLFGEMVDGERQGGVIGKNILGGIKKYLPDMKSYGITGALAGFLTPLGPIGGLLLGSSIGFAKNNQSIMSTLFGEGGLFKEESKQKLKKAIPKIAAGALVGGMAGPFGLLGNLVLGAGVGLASSTEGFRTAILGRYDEEDKEFKGGLIPTMRDAVLKPLKEFGGFVKETGMDFIKKHMLLPVLNAMDPIKKELSLLAKGMFDRVGNFLQDKFGEALAPINKWIEEKILRRLGNFISKFIIGGSVLAANVATLPFKAIGGVGNHFRKKHIKNGNADYMTAEERMQYADEKGISYDNNFDEYLNGLSDDEANNMYDVLSSVKNSGKSARKLRKQVGTRVGNNVSTYVDYDTSKDLMYHFKNGNMDKAEKIIRENKKGVFRRKRHNLNEKQQDELINYMKDNYEAYHNADTRQKLMDEERENLYTQLRKKGFKDINDKTVDKYLGMLDKERRSDKRKSNKIDENDPDITPSTRILLERQKERHTEIVSLMEEAINAIKGIEENTETIEERTVGDNKGSDSQVDLGDVTNADGTVINDMRDSYNGGKREPIIRIDEYGNVMEFKRTSDGELKADTSDSSTLEAIKAAKADDDREQSIVDQLKEMANKGGNGNNENEDGKKKKKKGGILGLLGGLGGMLKNLLNPKMLGAVGTAIMALPVLPQLLNAVMQDGISGLITQLPSLVFNGVEKGITEILPATMKSFWDYFNTHNGDDPSIVERGAHTAIRQIATGGKLSKVGLNHYEKLGKTLNTFGKTGKEGTRVGRFLSRGLKAMSPITYAKMGTKASLFTVPKIVGKGVGKVAEGVSKLYAKVDEKTGLKRLGEAAKSKISGYMTKTADAIGSKALGEAAKATDQTLVSKFITKISEFFSKLFSNKTVIKLVGAENAERLVKEFVPNFLKEITERLTKDAAKLGGKIAGLLATGGIVNIMFAIADFISGYNDAKDILGITEEPTLAMKIASGVLKSLNGLFIITSLIPERIYVNLVLDNMSFLFKDLQKMRARAKQQAKEYKEKNKIKGKFSVQDYNQKMREQNKNKNKADLNGDGKVGFFENVIDFGKQSFNTVKEWTVNSWNATKSALKSVGSAIASGASSAWNGIKSFGKNALGWLTGKGGDSAGKGDETPAGGYPSRMNNFTYYSQGDPRWNSERIDGTTVKTAGCGPTSMAMIISELTGQAHRPDEFVKDALAHGQWSRNGANWTMFKYFADKYGVPYQEAGSYDKFQQMAAQGIPQAVSGKKKGVEGSPFTNGGHIITVLGTDGNGNYIVNDPVSPERSKLYPNDIIQKGWRNSWGFGNPGTYNANGAGQTTYGTQQPGEQQQEQPSGLSGLFSDLTNAATKSFDKLYGLDKIVGMSSGTVAPSDIQNPTDPSTAGQGGDDLATSNIDFNPLLATDFADKSIIDKLKKTPDYKNNVLNKLKPYSLSANNTRRLVDSLQNNDRTPAKFYDGKGGAEGTGESTVKTIKGIPIGSKPLSEDVNKYSSIFQSAGSEFGVDPELLKAISMQESGGRPIKGAAWGLMQIENGGTTTEFINFGKNRPNGPYSSDDRLDPNKAIPFAAKRLSDDFKHYSGDFLKTTQAYNFSKYSLDALLKAFPNGDDWLAQRQNVGKYNGTGRSKYGDPKYIEHVFQYYQGNQIPADGIGSVNGGTGVATGASQGEQRSGFSGLMADLGDLLTGGFNKLYGLDEIFGSGSSGGTQSDPTGAGIDPNAPKIADDWYTRTLGGRMTSAYGNRKNPTGPGNEFHKGIDYGAAAGTAIKSPIDGVVDSNLTESQSHGFGNLLKIKDSTGATHYFAHMQQQSPLKEGTKVKSGDVVGKVGKTGNSTGPHLHYQINTTSDKNSHTEPNGYLAKLFGKLKSNTGQGGGNETKSTPSNKYNGMGGGYDTPKAPKLPNITRRGSIPVKEQPTVSETKLLSIIIEVLSKIADNTSSLSDIVQLLSKSLNVDISEEKINTIKSNNKSIGGSKKQVVNIIKNSLKDSKNPENANLLATLDRLALE